MWSIGIGWLHGKMLLHFMDAGTGNGERRLSVLIFGEYEVKYL
jgi:hypothetical protein